MSILQGLEANKEETIVAVHILRFGFVLCPSRNDLLRGVPREWPPGHKWVPIGDAASATCAECKAVAVEMIASGEVRPA